MKYNYLKKAALILGVPVLFFASILHISTGYRPWPTNVNPYQAIWFYSAVSFSLSILIIIFVKSAAGELTPNKMAGLTVLMYFLSFLSVAFLFFGYSMAGFS